MRRRTITIRIPQVPRRRWLAILVIGALAMSAAAYAAWAPFTLTNPKDGDTLSASLFATNFDAIKTKVTELQNGIDKPVYVNATTGKSYSLHAGYCGATAATTGAVADGALVGIAATKSLCQKACANSASAHMCTTVEIQRHHATGGTVPRGWYTAGMWTYDGSRVINDCVSWTSAANTVMGPQSYATDPAHDDPCDSSFPLLCCD
jgi:hypothetical protein